MPENVPQHPPVTPTPKPKPDDYDRAHVPMSEEFDRARWTLPPVGIVFIALGIVAVVVAIFSYGFRAKPVAAGGIGEVNAVQLQDNTILSAITLTVSNTTEKSWYIKEISATVQTDQGEQTDTAATAVDSERYFQAFPDLGKGTAPILKFDQKINPGQQVTGTIVVSFPITKDQFDARKSLKVTILPFDNRPFTLTK
ncbi:MAG TPA: DUF4352 domain-containing protein [Terriglobales bacterium]|nr:DUF4352 domain-containing protein [Terriglobales bacterium]